MEDRELQFQKFAKALETIYARSSAYGTGRRQMNRDYKYEDVLNIILKGSIAEKRSLSETMYNAGTIYTTIIDYYTNLHRWHYFATPTKFEGDKTNNLVEQALSFADNIKPGTTFRNILRDELIYGSYFGILLTDSKSELNYVMPFPYEYIRVYGEYTPGFKAFEVSINFWTRMKEDEFDAVNANMPSEVLKQIVEGQQWIKIPSEYAVGFEMPSLGPPFLMAIAGIINHLDHVEMDKERVEQALSLLIFQKLPLRNDGELIFSLEESATLHELFKEVLKNNKYADAITTFGDMGAVGLNKTEASTDNLTTPFQQVPLMVGMSQSLFMPKTAGDALLSVQKDHNLVVGYVERYNNWLDFQVKSFGSNINLRFLPVSSVNEKEYYAEFIKPNFSFGFYKMIPSILSGFKQSEIVAQLKYEQYLGFETLLSPPRDSHTLSDKIEPVVEPEE